MAEFVSRPRVKEGIAPTDPLDLTTKDYVDGRKVGDLADVDATGLEEGDLLAFDGEDWVPTSDPSVNSIFFDTATETLPQQEGQLVWDNDFDTLSFVLKGGDTVLEIGQETLFHVKNQTGSPIAKGTAVGFAGTAGSSGRLLVKPFIANGTEPSQYFVGIATEDIADGEDGYATHFGRLQQVNTSAFEEGDLLYVSATQTGVLTTVVPAAANNIIQVAAVITKSTNNGSIFIRPTIGSNINNDEGVRILNPQNDEVLTYDNGLWINAPAPAGGGDSDPTEENNVIAGRMFIR
jgi:hypothetical protein